MGQLLIATLLLLVCNQAYAKLECLSGWRYLNETDSCYQVFVEENELSLTEAEAKCAVYGARVSTAKTGPEIDLIVELTKKIQPEKRAQYPYINLVRPSNNFYGWRWSDSNETKATEIYWASREPNNVEKIEYCTVIGVQFCKENVPVQRVIMDTVCSGYNHKSYICKGKQMELNSPIKATLPTKAQTMPPPIYAESDNRTYARSTMSQITELQSRLYQLSTDGLLAASIALGIKLDLFRALADVSSESNHATAKQVADRAKCKERYVKEWLAVLACGDLIEVDEEEKFWMKQENQKEFLSPITASNFCCMVPILVKAYDKLVEVFKIDGPKGLPYADYGDFYDAINKFSQALHKQHLITDFIPMLGSGIKEKLEEGGMMCLDVGCGQGFHAALLAENFPKSNFTGIDITLSAVLAANQTRKDNGQCFDNLAFIQMDAGKMDDDWNEKYDIVTIFDACHDQMRPDLCLSEIHRVLKKDGVFAMLEVKGSSNIYEDKKNNPSHSAMMYACSMFHCLPVGSNSCDALGLGAMWGSARATEMLRAAGFTKIDIIPTPQFAINVLYLARK